MGLFDNDAFRSLGLSGEQGAYFHPNNENAALSSINSRNAINNDSQVVNGVAQYGQGNMSLGDALKQGNLGGEQQDELQQKLATDPMSGSRFATDQVQNNGILGQMYGKGGQLNQATDEATKLANTGYALTPEDHEAYGQASGNIARMFGAQEAGAAQSLADRGLASGGSGAAIAQYSGLAGNKNEQLAQAQTKIADARMNNNMQRLQQTRQYAATLAGQGEQAVNDQYNRQLAGAQNQRGNLNNAASLQVAQNKGVNDANLASLQDQRGAQGQTLGNAFGNGLFSGTQAMAGSGMSSMFGSPQKSGGSQSGSTGPNKAGNMSDNTSQPKPAMDPKSAAALA